MDLKEASRSHAAQLPLVEATLFGGGTSVGPRMQNPGWREPEAALILFAVVAASLMAPDAGPSVRAGAERAGLVGHGN